MADDVQTAEAPQTTAPAPPRGEYEFTESENALFSRLAGNLISGGWGVIVMTVAYYGLLFVTWAATGKPPYERFRFYQVWIPLMILVFAATFIRAGRAFDRVATTEGSDVKHLMTGLEELNGFFSWLPATWLVIVFGVLIGGGAALIHALGF